MILTKKTKCYNRACYSHSTHKNIRTLERQCYIIRDFNYKISCDNVKKKKKLVAVQFFR